jgi:DNA-binding response OmpR family regulator
MKILYVEDNESLAATVCSFLTSHGYQVEHFARGSAGLGRFAEDPQFWDLAMVDLELPDMSGQTVVSQISAQRPNLPIVVHSGVPGMKERYELISSGASALLAKPTEAQDLLDTLKGLIDLPPDTIR